MTDDATRQQTLRRIWALSAAVLSAVVAAGSMYAVVHVLAAYEGELRGAHEGRVRSVKVPVVARTLGVGHVITEQDLAEVEMSADFVPITALQGPEDIVGRTAIERILAGELVRIERLAPPSAGRGLNAIVPTGLRAISLDLADEQQVSGFIEPGDGVDLLVTIPSAGSADKQLAETVTLVQAARVLAVNEKISETVRGHQVVRQQVTLAVPPDIVERVTHALEVGRAKLTLRSEIDLTNVESNGTQVADLLGTEEKRLTVQQFRERVTEADVERMVEVIHGSETKREPVIDPRLIRGFD